jgi:hypothetical protein
MALRTGAPPEVDGGAEPAPAPTHRQRQRASTGNERRARLRSPRLPDRGRRDGSDGSLGGPALAHGPGPGTRLCAGRALGRASDLGPPCPPEHRRRRAGARGTRHRLGRPLRHGGRLCGPAAGAVRPRLAARADAGPAAAVRHAEILALPAAAAGDGSRDRRIPDAAAECGPLAQPLRAPRLRHGAVSRGAGHGARVPP